MGEWFDLTRWNRVPFEDEMRQPFAIGFLAVFAIGFLAALALNLRPPASIKNHSLNRRVVAQYSGWLMWVFGFGLAAYAFQLMGLPFLGWRVWTWVSIIALVLVVAVILTYLRTTYPRQRAAYEAQQVKRYYQQAKKQRPVGDNGQPIPRSARAEKRRQRTSGPAARGR